MSSLRLLVIVLTTMPVLAAALATSAYALPQFLPIAGSNKTFTTKTTGTSILENSAGTKVECTAGKGSGGFETDTLGTFQITFENCSSSGVKCTTEGDSTGLILSEGSLHFVYSALGTGESLGVAILFLPKETDFTCLGGLLNNKVKGTVLCLISSPLSSNVTHRYNCAAGEKKAGEAACNSYFNDNGTAVNAQLLSNLNEGGFKESNEQLSATITTAEAGAWMNE
jgi:hypothetical protein